MNIWFFIFFAMGAFVLQFVFTMMQMKSFTKTFRSLRNMGKVAIGKTKGGFKSGVIVLFSTDEEGTILEGSYMSGVTILARFKPLSQFNGENIATLPTQNLKGHPKQLQKTILNAASNYFTIINGGEVAEIRSPFGKISDFFGSIGKKEVIQER